MTIDSLKRSLLNIVKAYPIQYQGSLRYGFYGKFFTAAGHVRILSADWDISGLLGIYFRCHYGKQACPGVFFQLLSPVVWEILPSLNEARKDRSWFSGSHGRDYRTGAASVTL